MLLGLQCFVKFLLGGMLITNEIRLCCMLSNSDITGGFEDDYKPCLQIWFCWQLQVHASCRETNYKQTYVPDWMNKLKPLEPWGWHKIDYDLWRY
jgi:hypothetical protein